MSLTKVKKYLLSLSRCLITKQILVIFATKFICANFFVSNKYIGRQYLCFSLANMFQLLYWEANIWFNFLDIYLLRLIPPLVWWFSRFLQTKNLSCHSKDLIFCAYHVVNRFKTVNKWFHQFFNANIHASSGIDTIDPSRISMAMTLETSKIVFTVSSTFIKQYELFHQGVK